MPQIAEPQRPTAPASGKERILSAALLLFARRPYSETSLRDIATEAQVDVAYVHRAYGSKAEIFRRALLTLTPIESLTRPDLTGPQFIHLMCSKAFLRDPHRVEDVEPLHLLLRSCVCSKAREVIADFVETTIAEPLARAFGHPNTERALMAVSMFSGFVTHRTIIAHATLLAIPEESACAMLETTLLAVMQG